MSIAVNEGAGDPAGAAASTAVEAIESAAAVSSLMSWPFHSSLTSSALRDRRLRRREFFDLDEDEGGREHFRKKARRILARKIEGVDRHGVAPQRSEGGRDARILARPIGLERRHVVRRECGDDGGVVQRDAL